MKTIYSDQPFESFPNQFGVFLAGPTPRSSDVPSWRPEAISLLDKMGFQGVVYVPERQFGWVKANYDDQIDWEWASIERCISEDMGGLLLFWLPRDLKTMPAFTTNVEAGYTVRSERMYYGRPHNSPKCEYIDRLYKKHHPNRQPLEKLEEICDVAIKRT